MSHFDPHFVAYPGRILIPHGPPLCPSATPRTRSHGPHFVDSSELNIADGDAKVDTQLRCWLNSKNEIMSYAHRIPLADADTKADKRNAGSFKNEIYVATQGMEFPSVAAIRSPKEALLVRLIDREIDEAVLQKLAPKKVLLRIYGPFEHGHFDRDNDSVSLAEAGTQKADLACWIDIRKNGRFDGSTLLYYAYTGGPSTWKRCRQCPEIAKRIAAYDGIDYKKEAPA
ncbi:hypothetical protein CEK25_004619 [Fusarium fujikuroi]|nr:hypothetical protein CEK25_004619 [Fusarium fujikuroi]